MIFKAVVFDLDGTLYNSIDDIADAGNKALSEAGLKTHTPADYISWIGNGAYKLVERSLPEEYKDEVNVTKFLQAFLNNYSKNYDAKSSIYEGIPAILEYINAMKIPMGIFSNKPHDLTVKIIEKDFSKWSFKSIYGQRKEYPRKPDPMVAIIIADELKVKTSEILYVGDSVTDIETAQAAGMISVGVTWGYCSKKRLINANPDYLNDSPIELLKLIQLLNN